MRPEQLFLSDILQATEAIDRSLRNRSFPEVEADEDLHDATLFRLIAIGEAAARLPATVRQRYPDVPWIDMIGFRNRAVHAYFAIDWRIVWDTARQDIPLVHRHVATILAEDYALPSAESDPT